MPGHAYRAGGGRAHHVREDAHSRLSHAGVGRHGVGLPGNAGGRRRAAAAAADGIRAGARTPSLRVQETAGVQLGAGRRRRHRHGAFLLPAHAGGAQRRGVQRARAARGARLQRADDEPGPRALDAGRPAPALPREAPPGGHGAGCIAPGRCRRALLADRPVPDAVPRLHAQRRRRADLPRPELGAYRRPLLLDLLLLLEPRQAAHARGDRLLRQRRRGVPRARCALRCAAQPRQRVPARPRDAEERELHRHRRRVRAGRGHPGQPGAHRGPFARDAGADRHRGRAVSPAHAPVRRCRREGRRPAGPRRSGCLPGARRRGHRAGRRRLRRRHAAPVRGRTGPRAGQRAGRRGAASTAAGLTSSTRSGSPA
jgi:hypothetical protein